MNTQTKNLQQLELQRRKILTQFQQYKSSEIQQRESQQKQYYEQIQQ